MGTVYQSHQISKEVSSFPHPQFIFIAKSRNKVDIWLDPGWVGLEADVDEAGKEVVCGCGGVGPQAELKHLEHFFGTLDQAGHFVLRGQLPIDFQYVC